MFKYNLFYIPFTCCHQKKKLWDHTIMLVDLRIYTLESTHNYIRVSGSIQINHSIVRLAINPCMLISAHKYAHKLYHNNGDLLYLCLIIYYSSDACPRSSSVPLGTSRSPWLPKTCQPPSPQQGRLLSLSPSNPRMVFWYVCGNASCWS